MFETLGVADLEALIAQTVPEAIRQEEPLDFGKAMSERELLCSHARRSPRRTRS